MSYLVECSLEQQGAPILEIFNDAILNTTSLYDYQARTMDDMESWFETKRSGNFPVIGLQNQEGDLMGFATYGTFRPQTAYLHTVEHSLYVHPNYRRKGIGRRLLKEIVERAKQEDYHLMLGLIDSNNVASIQLHISQGFTHSGTIEQAGYKFERWLDVAIYQLKLR